MKGLNCDVWVGLVWFVVNEEQGKYESLNHCSIIMDMHNVANQKPYRNGHKTPNSMDFLVKQCQQPEAILSSIKYKA